METSEKHYMFLLMQLLISCMLCFMAKVEASKRNVSAFLVFGDSTVDPGNNNYIGTPFRSNFSPYGRDFANKVPTGRFTNGKLATDFIASYIGVKELVPPYLDPKLSNEELLTGVSFASAGSGFDPLTPSLTKVIPIQKQLEYFKEYKQRIEGLLGKQGTEEHIKKAAFLVSAEGARKIAVVGLPPMGCLPIMITLNSVNTFNHRGCIDKYSSVGRDYNLKLQNELHLIQLNNASNHGAKIYYFDIYQPLVDQIQDHERLGFKYVDCGCCGTGYIEASFLCNQYSPICLDSSEYIFFDSIHPTEKAYYDVFMNARPVIDSIIND
ncbi:hypothetical protein L6164_036769 [Bauhinia variegata]|uniref:Uncharacterized protein n=1 Tax=Bauhinia variegata TaxID=167791 RepID=A0ACB9KI24_BAUVA|nr:hypothetical protein L6164_036769 [Bauhinia variegata]